MRELTLDAQRRGTAGDEENIAKTIQGAPARRMRRPRGTASVPTAEQLQALSVRPMAVAK